jgi:hypothetical protein
MPSKRLTLSIEILRESLNSKSSSRFWLAASMVFYRRWTKSAAIEGYEVSLSESKIVIRSSLAILLCGNDPKHMHFEIRVFVYSYVNYVNAKHPLESILILDLYKIPFMFIVGLF